MATRGVLVLYVACFCLTFIFLFGNLLFILKSYPGYSSFIPRPALQHILIPIPEIKPKAFQVLEGLEPKFYVYSALRHGKDIRIVSLKMRDVHVSNVLCALWRVGNKHSVDLMKSTVSELYGQGSEGYVATTITCHRNRSRTITFDFIGPNTGLNFPSLDSSYWVGLIVNEERNASVAVSIPVEGFAPRWEETGPTSLYDKYDTNIVQFTVCVPPMFGPYNNEALLIEKLEYSRLMGAGRVVLYNNSISPGVDSILRWYQQIEDDEDGSGKWGRLIVDVRSWIRPILHAELHYGAQISSIDDCLNLYRWQSRYIEFSDMDELIVPLVHRNWSDLIAHRRSVNPEAKAYMFRSTCIIKEIPSPAKGFEDEAAKYGSSVLGYTKRDDFIYSQEDRSKVIVDPRQVKEVGVHLVWVPNSVTEVVSVNEALLFHYRNKPIEPTYSLIDDPRASDLFGKQLAERLEYAWSSIHKHREKL